MTTKVSKFAGVGWALMSCWIKAKCFVSFDHPFNDISVQLKAQRFTDYNERDVVPVWEDETFWEKQQKKNPMKTKTALMRRLCLASGKLIYQLDQSLKFWLSQLTRKTIILLGLANLPTVTFWSHSKFWKYAC